MNLDPLFPQTNERREMFEITGPAMARCHEVIASMLESCGDKQHGLEPPCMHVETMEKYFDELNSGGPDVLLQHLVALQATIVNMLQGGASSMNCTPEDLWERISFTLQVQYGITQLNVTGRD